MTKSSFFLKHSNNTSPNLTLVVQHLVSMQWVAAASLQGVGRQLHWKGVEQLKRNQTGKMSAAGLKRGKQK